MSESNQGRLVIAGGSRYAEFTAEIAAAAEVPVTPVRHRRFLNSELHCQYESNLRGAHVFNVQTFGQEDGWSTNDALIELALMNDAAMRASAASITNVLPWFPYARQDQKHAPRVPISAAFAANMLANSGGKPFERFLSVDLHSGQIQGNVSVPFDHLPGKKILLPHLKERVAEWGPRNVVISPPDSGRVALAEDFANELGVGFAVMNKRRSKEDSSKLKIARVIGDSIADKVLVIVDDMIDTGGTLVEAARQGAEEGASKIVATCTHPVLSGDAVSKIHHSTIDEVIATDTFPKPDAGPEYRLDTWFKQLTTTGYIGKAIREIFENGSINQLIEES